MPTAVAHLETDARDPDASSYVTGSVSLGAGELGLIWITTGRGTTPTAPSITGWTLITDVLWSTAASPTRRTSLLRRMPASPESGTLTIDYSGVTQTACLYSIVKVTGAVTTGTNGADAIGQFKPSFSDTAQATGNIVMDSTPDAASAMLAGYSWNNQGTLSAGVDWSMLAQDATSTSTINIGTEYFLGSDDTVGMTNTNSARWAGIAVEILASTSLAIGQPSEANMAQGITAVIAGQQLRPRRSRQRFRTAVIDRSQW